MLASTLVSSSTIAISLLSSLKKPTSPKSKLFILVPIALVALLVLSTTKY
jgi:hypothetical protein